ncbi:RNA polymerase rpb1 c-terminal repeat domain protein [Seiridium cupressi]
MADRKKTTGVAPSVAKTPKTQSRILEKLRVVGRLCGEIEKEDSELQKLETQQETIGQLKNQLDLKIKEATAGNATIARLEAENTTMATSHAAERETIMRQFNVEKEILMNNFASQGCTWKEALLQNEVYQQQIETLSVKVEKVSREAQRLQQRLGETEAKHTPCVQELEKSRDQIISLKSEIDTKSLDLELQRRNLENAEKKLVAFTKDIGFTDIKPSELQESLAVFANNCHDFVRSFFVPGKGNLGITLKDLSEQNMGSIAPRNFLVLLGVEQPQFVEMAIVEAAIADVLISHIFRPHYVLDTLETAELLEHLSEKKPRREALVRCQLAQAKELSENDTLRMASDVAQRIVGLLFERKTETTIKFHDGLVVIFRKGIDMWRAIQRNRLRPRAIGVVNHDTDWNENIDKLGDYDSLVNLEPEQEVFRPEIVDPLLTLFPRIFMGKEIIHRGFALWPDQNAVVAAHISYQGLGKRTSQSMSRRRRSGSVANHSAAANRTSFSGRMHQVAQNGVQGEPALF